MEPHSEKGPRIPHYRRYRNNLEKENIEVEKAHNLLSHFDQKQNAILKLQ